jgi:autotransporter-associated beta strand protein
MTVNFDGGVLKPYDADNSTWIMPGYYNRGRVYIKEGGATFDTDGHNMGIAVAIEHGGVPATDGGLTKTGLGTLTLTGANTYTGPTIVSAGVLSLSQAYLNDASLVRIDSGATLNLNYSGTDAVRFLFVGGAPKPAGLYDASLAGGYLTGSGVLQALYAPLNGDANADGTVNGADLNIVLSNYNRSGDWFGGDFDGDHTVNGSDLNVVLSNYNQSLGLSAAVPEPSTLLLVAAGLVGLLAYAWRKRS